MLEIFILILKLAMCHHHFSRIASTIRRTFFPSHHFTVIVIHPFRFRVCSCKISSGILQINRCALLYFPFPYHFCLHSFPFSEFYLRQNVRFHVNAMKNREMFPMYREQKEKKNANEEENCMIGNLHLLSNAAS